MSYEKIRVEQDGPVTKIILNQPGKLNACAPDMADEIREALASTRDARCFLITGEGRAFCSGADLSGGPRDRTTSGGRPGSTPMSAATLAPWK